MLLGAVGFIAVVSYLRSKAEGFVSKVEEAAKAVETSQGSTPAGPAEGFNTERTPEGSWAAPKPSEGSGGVVSGGGSNEPCMKAAACCSAMIAKTGGDANAQKGCEMLKSIPAMQANRACEQALETYRKAAPMLGFKCE